MTNLLPWEPIVTFEYLVSYECNFAKEKLVSPTHFFNLYLFSWPFLLMLQYIHRSLQEIMDYSLALQVLLMEYDLCLIGPC